MNCKLLWRRHRLANWFRLQLMLMLLRSCSVSPISVAALMCSTTTVNKWRIRRWSFSLFLSLIALTQFLATQSTDFDARVLVADAQCVIDHQECCQATRQAVHATEEWCMSEEDCRCCECAEFGSLIFSSSLSNAYVSPANWWLPIYQSWHEYRRAEAKSKLQTAAKVVCVCSVIDSYFDCFYCFGCSSLIAIRPSRKSIVTQYQYHCFRHLHTWLCCVLLNCCARW